MLSEKRQKEKIREYLFQKFGSNVPADEALKYSVGAIPDKPGYYGVFKTCDLSAGHGHQEAEWFEGEEGE